jgi:hypothetical protein
MTGEQRAVLQQALEDAVYYRDPPLQCPACETAADLCGACAERLAIGLVYLQTARELGLDSVR